MRQRSVLLLAGALLLSGLPLVSALAEDRLELTDGRVLVGTYLGGTADEVRFSWASSEQVLPRQRVKRLELGARPGGSPPATVASADLASAVSEVAPARAQLAAVPSTVPGPSLFPALRPGTVLMVNLGQTLDSRYSRVGQRFIGSLASDVAIDGVVVLPRNTQVQGELREVRSAGNLFGSSEMQVVLTTILIDNRELPCVTDAPGIQGGNSTFSTIRNAGAGAAIGGIIDGKHGAWTGLIIGSAASLLTRGEDVRLGAGAVLDFRLVQPFVR